MQELNCEGPPDAVRREARDGVLADPRAAEPVDGQVALESTPGLRTRISGLSRDGYLAHLTALDDDARLRARSDRDYARRGLRILLGVEEQ